MSGAPGGGLPGRPAGPGRRSTSRAWTSAPTTRGPARRGDALLAARRRQAHPARCSRWRPRAGAAPTPTTVLPTAARARAHPHVLAHPRRPAGDRRRHAAARAADLPRRLRRGRRHPRRRRALRGGVQPGPAAAAGGPPARCSRPWPRSPRPPACRAWSAASTWTWPERPRPTTTLRTLHALKTGRLIQAAVVCGALLSGAEDVAPYRAFAAELGLLFQIVDDILDETGAEDELGKSVGKDQALDKVTYVSRFGMERAVELADEAQQRALRLLAELPGDTADLAAVARFIHERRRWEQTPSGLPHLRRPPGAATDPVLYSGDDAVSGQDLRPRRPPTILRARADAARRRDPRDHHRERLRDRRSPRAEPRVVELTLALHRALDCPKDRIVWDVGHQCYVHKLLTGRRERLRHAAPVRRRVRLPQARASRRTTCFDTGHASDSICSALGLRRGARRRGERRDDVVASSATGR